MKVKLPILSCGQVIKGDYQGLFLHKDSETSYAFSQYRKIEKFLGDYSYAYSFTISQRDIKKTEKVDNMIVAVYFKNGKKSLISFNSEADANQIFAMGYNF